jgi:DNA repair exonuclease SbcCD ATPase subunit
MTNLVAMETLFDSSTKEINKLKKRLQEKLNETNPYTERVKERQIKKDNLNNKLLLSKDSLQKLNAEHTATSYWVQGFKRVRLFIIEETLRALELEVNNALASLGLVDWQVEFDVERENKSGGVTKGFVVFIRCPSNPEPVRWESWSGGETQRLQLAGDFGLANLIMLQAGLTNTIEFYDEPSNHLSDEGLVDLAETLHQRASEDGKRIILVDHRMPDFGDFAGVITVTKDEEGSTIE